MERQDQTVRFVRQLSRYGCGHACLAMALDVSYAEALSLVGHETRLGTTAADLIPHLRAVGYTCPDRLVRGWPEPPPKMALIRVPILLGRGGRIKRSHWMLYMEPYFYDPARSPTTGTTHHNAMRRCITSHLPLEFSAGALPRPFVKRTNLDQSDGS